MSQRNICPICGSENPEGSEFCQVCRANLQALPDEIFPAESEQKNDTLPAGAEKISSENEELGLDSTIPVWLQERFLQKDKSREKTNFDFDSFSDAIFGVQNEPESSSPTKVLKPKPKRQKKKGPVYQPQLEMLDAPLVEEADGMEKSVPEDNGILKDFKTLRPVKKWDDPQNDQLIESVREQSDKAFSAGYQIPLLWQQDLALVEEGEPDVSKNAGFENDEFLNSVSPTKLADAAAIFEPDGKPVNRDPVPDTRSDTTPSDPGEFQPERGTLLSDLMNEMDRNSESLTPREMRENRSGTVFYSGNSPQKPSAPETPEPVEFVTPEEETGPDAAVLDQILRGIGYQVEEAQPVPESQKPENNDENKQVTEDPVNPEDNTRADEEQKPDPALIEDDSVVPHDPIPEKIDAVDEQDIPWDLFSAQDMSLPQSPEDPAYRTFSRSSIPEEAGNTTYQQRMMSSVLGKIIQAENFVLPKKNPSPRKVSMGVRFLWALLAIGGVILILFTGISDRLVTPPAENTAETMVFYRNVQDVSGTALVIVDYTPAYEAELDASAEKVLQGLENNAEKVHLAVLNPAAMPKARALADLHKEKIEFEGWWPAGVISMRSHLVSGNVPQNIWLITSESGSFRTWAEQLAISEGGFNLHILAPGQLEPLLRPYLDAGLVTSAMSNSRDLRHHDSNSDPADRKLYAVWYLAALLPLAWVGGMFTKFLSSDPNYARKKPLEKEEPEKNSEKGADNVR